MREIHVMAEADGVFVANRVIVTLTLTRKADDCAAALEAGENAVKDLYALLKSANCTTDGKDVACGIVTSAKKGKYKYEYKAVVEFCVNDLDLYEMSRIAGVAESLFAELDCRYENVSDKESFIHELTKKAIETARNRAAFIAETQGCKLGDMMSITQTPVWTEECENNSFAKMLTVTVDTKWQMAE